MSLSNAMFRLTRRSVSGREAAGAQQPVAPAPAEPIPASPASNKAATAEPDAANTAPAGPAASGLTPPDPDRPGRVSINPNTTARNRGAAPVGKDEAEIVQRVHELRAHEPGRGRAARSVFQIPLTGWRDILRRAYREVTEDQVGLTAAGVTFYTILALFPAMVLVIAIYGLVTDPSTITSHLSLVSGLMPATASELIAGEMTRLTLARNSELGLAALAAIAFTVWSANGAVKALFAAMNIAYDERETRGFIRLTLITLAFTVASAVGLVLVLNAMVLLPLALDYFGMSQAGSLVAALLPTAVLVAMMIFAISTLYRFGPSRRPARWKWVSPGATISTLLIIAVSAAFSTYLANWGDYGATYGSLGAAMGLMMWIYLSTYIVIVGAELNAEIEHQTASDTTVGSARPLGGRRAYVADTVGTRY